MIDTVQALYPSGVPGQVTICTPVGPGHEQLVPRAQASVQAQTVPCEHLVMHDLERIGTGAMRNRLLAEVRTPFVVFLDADDWLEPTFVEKCLRAWTPGHYVYTDWVQDKTGDYVYQAPCLRVKDGVISVAGQHPWCGGSYHIVTTLIPTDLARAVNGFDETLPAMEDTDFYMKLCASKRCGIRVAEPLFHYGGEGMRARTFFAGEYKPIQEMIGERYRGQVGCCGDSVEVKLPPAGERQPGDVLAQAMWSGHQHKRGRVTGRLYPRIGRPATAWVDPRDMKVSPDWWIPAPQEAPPKNGNGAHIGDEPVLKTSQQVADYLNAVTGGARAQERVAFYQAPQPVVQSASSGPDVAGILAKVSGITQTLSVAHPSPEPAYETFPSAESKTKRGRPRKK